jgi:FAD/FMN-containing dehydrogenase
VSEQHSNSAALSDPLQIDLLRAHIAGDVLSDAATRRAYASDASPYRQTPMAVVRPRDRDDVVTLQQIAAEHRLAVIPRAAGTSLAGQCVGPGIVVDMGAYQHHILEFDPGMRRVTVQPGVVRDVLNRQLAPHRLLFAPDPSTTDRCQIGGMIGNNAWGLHAVGLGTTREHVTALELVLADGTVIDVRALNAAQLGARCERGDREGNLYRAVTEAIGGHAPSIAAGYPSTRGITSNSGYALDALLRGQPWKGHGPRFNLAGLLCGAEGTLAIVTAATLKLIETPVAARLCCLHFDDVGQALNSVSAICETGPVALELLDRAILRVADLHAEQRANRFWLSGDPGAVLLVEYAGTTPDGVEAQLRGLLQLHAPRAASVVDGADIERVWALRRAALKMLMEAEGGLRAITGIEDAAVAVKDLPAYYAEVQTILAGAGLAHYVYGPVGMGSLHVRPELAVDRRYALAEYERLLDEVAAITVRYGGSFSCKHGDGRMRGKYLEAVLGAGPVAAMRQVKAAFDPAGILNPGKILDCPPLTSDLALTAPR